MEWVTQTGRHALGTLSLQSGATLPAAELSWKTYETLAAARDNVIKTDGNVTKAAKALKVSSSDLRRLTWQHPTLIMDALEHAHGMVDKAEAKLLAALDGDHAERSLRAALFILSHNDVAWERGWSRAAGGYDDVYPRLPAPTTINVIWQGDMPPGYRPLAPNVPEARAALSASTDPASKGDRIH